MSDWNERWQLLRKGNSDAATNLMRTAYEAKRSTSRAIELAVLLMWQESYRPASTHMAEFIERFPEQTTIAFGIAGTAQWCSEDRLTAAQTWKKGLSCSFVDAAGGAELPLLLYFAAVLGVNLESIEEAECRLRNVASNPQAENWPGPLVQLVLGRLNRDTVEEFAVWKDPSNEETRLNLLKVAFWDGVLSLREGDQVEFIRAMSYHADLSWVDFDANPEFFIDRIWCPEFFLARHHAQPTALPTRG